MRINGFVMAILLLCVKNTSAQKFGARAVVGFNMSQIAGDQMAGFDKFGFVGGLRGTANLVDKLDLNVDFLYSVRGSRPGIFNPSVDPDINVTLKYLDLPVYLTYSDWYDEVKGYYKAYFLGGFSYGRLMSATTSDNFNDGEDNLDVLVEFFNENDFSWLLGFGFRLSKRFEIQFRYTSSITLLLNAEKNNLNTFSLRPFFLTIRGEYIF
jgi:Outer membrane protein beta-barrel domain